MILSGNIRRFVDFALWRQSWRPTDESVGWDSTAFGRVGGWGRWKIRKLQVTGPPYLLAVNDIAASAHPFADSARGGRRRHLAAVQVSGATGCVPSRKVEG